MLIRAAAHLSDTTAMPQGPWYQCFCGLPQYFAHTSNSTQSLASWQCKWILTHNLTLIIPALSHDRSNHLSCNIHAGVYPTWFIHGGVYSRWLLAFTRSIALAIFESKSSARSAILSEVRAGYCPSCDRLQQYHIPHKVGPFLSFPHASPVTAPQPSNALWCGFKLAHRENSTKSC